MGKSSARRKKTGPPSADPSPKPPPFQPPPIPTSPSPPSPSPSPSIGSEIDSSVFIRRAHELKEEGNRRFQAKDFSEALGVYQLGLKLLPRSHPDRAIFHSNRAACLLQMTPVDHSAVVAECSLALAAQPGFPRALLRRARALEAIGRLAEAADDVSALLAADPDHREAAELARRLHVPPAQPSRPSPAALGASAVRGAAPVGGLGPCLPARPPPPKKPPPPKPNSPPPSSPKLNPPAADAAATVSEQPRPSPPPPETAAAAGLPLKLVYDHDIRLAELGRRCGFRALRETVSKRFPCSNSVLIKFRDADGDLVTITSSAELALAVNSLPPGDTLKLHIVEVPPAQEPPLPEEEEDLEQQPEEKNLDSMDEKQVAEAGMEGGEDQGRLNEEVVKRIGDLEGKKEEEAGGEVEMDDWLFEFAQLFRTQVGIDPDAHLDLHELGMELCSEALEETVTSEEAQELLAMAAGKFQEVAALALFNWGNVYMCAARKRMPLDPGQLRPAFDWVRERYALAGDKYETALTIKPDFYEGLLALGQQLFEMAKLQWSFAMAAEAKLEAWDSAETMALFDAAEEKMAAASGMWEKVEEQRVAASQREEALRKKKTATMTTTAAVEDEAAAMRSQIHLFWGNLLFERSQVEFKLQQGDWKKNLDAALERFGLAGASQEDIDVVLKNHFSNSNANTKEKTSANAEEGESDEVNTLSPQG
ncbi:octicosapeptide/Phox/Bem1p (PB1) domain-containing protein / tetratricopeptide repeat (TPR)-containing protein [Wolffia australiana]